MNSFSSFLDKKRHFFIFAIILCLGILAFRGSLSASFYFDDYVRIVDNFRIKRFDLQSLWDHDPSRFVTNLSFNLNYLAVRLNLKVWHAVNLFLHVLNAYVVYRLTLLTFQTPVLLSRYAKNDQHRLAVVASLIFLLHPVQTQAAIYLVQRSTLLYSLFYLWTLYLYARARIEGNDKFYAAAIAAAFIGIFTKPSFMTLPLGIALYDFCFFGFSKTRNLKQSAVYFLLALPLLIIPLITWNKGILLSDAVEGLKGGGFSLHFWTYFNVLITFVRLLILPVNLNLDYDYPLARGFFDFPMPFSMLAVLGIGVAGIKAYQKAPWMTFCVFWFFIALGAHIGFFPLADLIFEHWVYLSCFGFALGLALTLFHICPNRRVYMALTGVLLAVLFTLTSQRSNLWGDPLAFLNDTAAKSPNKARVWNNLGMAYRERKQFEQAQQAFEKAVALDPVNTKSPVNLADIYITQNENDKAKVLLERTLKMDPENSGALLNLGRLAVLKGDYAEALRYTLRARSLSSYNPHIWMTLANIYEKIGDLTAAKQAMSSALWLDPKNATLYYNLGNINFQLKNYYEAMINYTEAIRKAPGFTAALNNLGYIYFYFQDYKKASEYYQKAIKSAPDLPEAYFHLGNVLYEIGQVDDSKSAITKAVFLYRQQGKGEMADSLEKKLNALAN